VSGPRWIAEPVDLALEESKLALDQEMDQVHAARATAEAANLSAATAHASSSAVAVAEPVEPAISAQANVTESTTTTELTSSVIAAQANIVEFAVSESKAGEPPAAGPSTANSEPQAAPEPSAYAAA